MDGPKIINAIIEAKSNTLVTGACRTGKSAGFFKPLVQKLLINKKQGMSIGLTILECKDDIGSMVADMCEAMEIPFNTNPELCIERDGINVVSAINAVQVNFEERINMGKEFLMKVHQQLFSQPGMHHFIIVDESWPFLYEGFQNLLKDAPNNNVTVIWSIQGLYQLKYVDCETDKHKFVKNCIKACPNMIAFQTIIEEARDYYQILRSRNYRRYVGELDVSFEMSLENEFVKKLIYELPRFSALVFLEKNLYSYDYIECAFSFVPKDWIDRRDWER